MTRWLIFSLDEGRYALPLLAVERVVRAVFITPVPLAPRVVLGAIDVEGSVLPVLSIRHRFDLPERRIVTTDQLIIAQTRERRIGLAIDQAQGVIEFPLAEVVPASQIARQLVQTPGVIRLEDGLVLIQDLEQALSEEEARSLDEALSTDLSHAP